MKKLLFFVLTAALMFGCKNNDNDTTCPVSGATLPTSSAKNPIPAGSAVTIQGRGFTASSEIWLRGVATKADGDVQADVTGFTSTSITFTAPGRVGRAERHFETEWRRMALRQTVLRRNIRNSAEEAHMSHPNR